MDSTNTKNKVIIVTSSLPSDNIILTGFMGCGKSYFSSRLAQALGFRLKDSDAMIEADAKLAIKDIFSQYGEAYFRRLESQAADKIKTLSSCVIATGGGFPIYYEDIKSLGTVIYMQIPFEEIVKRMTPQDIAKRPLFSDMKKAKELFDSREALYKERSHFHINASASIDEMINQTKDFLSQKA